MPIDLRDPTLPESAVRAALNLSPHPEGGHYREIWRDQPGAGVRGAASSILFLLADGERSLWHRVDAAELWLWQGGSALLLGVAQPPRQRSRSGSALTWQAAMRCRGSCRPMRGKTPAASAPGRW